jgi:hypothetical protein
MYDDKGYQMAGAKLLQNNGVPNHMFLKGSVSTLHHKHRLKKKVSINTINLNADSSSTEFWFKGVKRKLC